MSAKQAENYLRQAKECREFTSLPTRQTITVVKEFEPGIRCRRFLTMWINPSPDRGEEVLVPDDLFDYRDWEAV
jgi:hypothetical protein